MYLLFSSEKVNRIVTIFQPSGAYVAQLAYEHRPGHDPFKDCLSVPRLGPDATELPHLKLENGVIQLVNVKPFLVLGRELGHSSAVLAADLIVPRLATRRVNTILMAVTWEQTEAKEGNLDFGILDHHGKRTFRQ